MSKTTNLELFKHDNVTTNTDAFNVEKALNENWDKIDTAVGENNSDIASIKTKNTDQDTRLTNIETKNATQDTNISALQEDVEEMQENIQSNIDEIEDLKEETERLRNDISSISITEEAEGEDITLTDTSDARFAKFDVKGNDYQETREGYNLLDIMSNFRASNAGLTVSADEETGYITVNGTAEDTYINLLSGSTINITNILEDGETYTLWQENTDGTDCSGVYAQILGEKADGSNIFYTSKSNGRNYQQIIVDKSTVETYRLSIQTGNLLETFNNYKNRFMLVKGSYTASTIPEYELYGASPSTDYPSEVKTVKNNVNIVVCNKNLIGFDDIAEQTKNGVTFSAKDGILTLNGTATNIAYIYEITHRIILHYNTYHILKIIPISGTFSEGGIGVREYDSNNQQLWYNQVYNVGDLSSKKLIALPATKASKSQIYFTSAAVFNNFKCKIQLEEGETATSYVEHEEQESTIPVHQEMLTGDGFIKVDGVWKELHNWNKKTFTGTENIVSSGITNVFYLASIQDYKISDENICYSNCFKSVNNVSGAAAMGNQENGTIAFINSRANYRFYIKTSEYSSVSDLKVKLAELYNSGNPMLLYYKLETPITIECTYQQKQILDEIEKTIHTYKEKTHVYSTDELSPIFSVEAIKDTNTVISNIQSMLLEN